MIHSKEGGSHVEQGSNRQKTMEGTRGAEPGIHRENEDSHGNEN